jgi:hypothetical protein
MTVTLLVNEGIEASCYEAVAIDVLAFRASRWASQVQSFKFCGLALGVGHEAIFPT